MKLSAKERGELARLNIVAEACEEAIGVLLDDTGPLYRLPELVRGAIRGELDSVIRTIEIARDDALEMADRLEAKRTR